MTADDAVNENLAMIERAEGEILALYKTQISAGGSVGCQHLYLFGIARRALAQSKAFRQMVDSRNSLVANSLVRLQLDTMLRLYVAFFVADPDDFATKVFEGTPINKIKDAKGKLMTDSYLRDRVATQNDWVTSVYGETSGYIHFSNRHIHAAIAMKTKEIGLTEIQIGPYDVGKPIAYYGELVRAFLHITMMIPVAAADWFSNLKSAPGKIIGLMPGLNE